MTKVRGALPLFVTFALMAGFICLFYLPAQGADVSKQSMAPLVNEQGCNAKIIDAILTVVEKDIVPLTQQGVKKGNKVFGAAVMKKDDLSLVMAGTNHESECPLWHGEVYTIKKLYVGRRGQSRKSVSFLPRMNPVPCASQP